MTFETPQPNFSSERNEYTSPVAQEIDPITLQGAELEAAIKAGAIDLNPINELRGTMLEAAFRAGVVDEEGLMSQQKLDLHNMGYQMTLPEGEVTLPGAETIH